MSFRFQIKQTFLAGRPFVVLVGDLLEGEVRIGDRILVPLLDGGKLERFVNDVLAERGDRSVGVASVADKYDSVGITFDRRGDHRKDDIALEIATSAEPSAV